VFNISLSLSPSPRGSYFRVLLLTTRSKPTDEDSKKRSFKKWCYIIIIMWGPTPTLGLKTLCTSVFLGLRRA
jgi:hypothetical protein